MITSPVLPEDVNLQLCCGRLPRCTHGMRWHGPCPGGRVGAVPTRAVCDGQRATNIKRTSSCSPHPGLDPATSCMTARSRDSESRQRVADSVQPFQVRSPRPRASVQACTGPLGNLSAQSSANLLSQPNKLAGSALSVTKLPALHKLAYKACPVLAHV